ncbi:MAG: aminotransferase class III-fold pyridoxal phosphate-dependent enzyme [Candidatus Hydrogenedens sp.]|nr:aminotransferase class III-fold pyridoxal phosphate-dependent enzyme [Candidatus Hydrogenedens sp.]
MSQEATAALQAKAKANYLQPFTPIHVQQQNGPRVITRGKGMRVWDSDGNEYLDMMAGLWCVAIGYGRDEMADAISDQVKELCYYQSFANNANDKAIELAAKIGELAPGDLNRVFFGLSGSDANDTNIKIVWYYNNLRGKPQKKKIISRRGSYHGVTIASGSLTGLPPIHAHFDLPYGDRFVHVDKPHHFWMAQPGETEQAFSQRLAQQLDDTILRLGPDNVGAFIAEPIIGAGGVVVPSAGYFAAIKPVLDKHDVLLISDEVICGFGRLGRWFGCEHYDFQPDIMTIAKGLTSGYVPMGGSVVSDKIWNVLRDGAPNIGPFAHGFTYGGHPVSAAAGLKNLEIFERENLVENARETGQYLQDRLHETLDTHPLVGEVRGVGAVAGVELAKDRDKREAWPAEANIAVRAAALCLKRGVIVRQIMNTLAISPPLVLSRADVDEAVEKLKASLDELADQLTQSGEWKA